MNTGGSMNFLWGGGGGGGGGAQTLVQIICGKFSPRPLSRSAEKAETTTCFSICERWLPLAREILLCEQRQSDNGRVRNNKKITLLNTHGS